MLYYRVALKTKYQGSVLVYSSELTFKQGDFVLVPLRTRKLEGVVVAEEKTAPSYEVKPILEHLPQLGELQQKEIEFYQWVASYYHYSLGELIFETIPKRLKRPRPLSPRSGMGKPISHAPTEDQQKITEALSKKLNHFGKHLIHGVTGSGKTQVYLHLIKKVMSEQKNTLFLLPEINLTPQFLETLTEHIEGDIYIYNSALSASERFMVWKEVREKETPFIVLGVRSSVFLPIKNLGLIVVDEEHDSSFKQDDRCPYNARDLAIKKAQQQNIPVILGSATPLLETYWNHTKTPGSYWPILKRVNQLPLPQIELERPPSNEAIWPLSEKMLALIEKACAAGEQVVVFVNRLGYSNYLQCRSCGHHFSCPNCSSNLRYFKSKKEISCYICGYKDRAPEVCPECQNMTLLPVGFGTEKVQGLLQEKFPKLVIERFDREEITTNTKLEDKLKRFHEGKIDVFVGTQMIAKGHNFRRVNLVIVLGIDHQLNYPDFRANERVYQLLKQVTGRAGRYECPGQVVIQTHHPESEIFSFIQDESLEAFYKSELPLRDFAHCPPFCRLAMLYFFAPSQELLGEDLGKLAFMMEKLAQESFPAIEILGPRPGIIEKRVNQYMWSMMIKSGDLNQLHNFLSTIQQNYTPSRKVTFKVDIDPYSLM